MKTKPNSNMLLEEKHQTNKTYLKEIFDALYLNHYQPEYH